MEQSEIRGGGSARGGPPQQNTLSRSLRRAGVSVFGLGLVGTLLAVRDSVAQEPGGSRLTVRPRAMATGTRNPAMGVYPLESMRLYLVSVPQQCVGARRCPLFVWLGGAGYNGAAITKLFRPVADKYGMILLAPTALARNSEYATDPDKSKLDAALKEVLQKFAIDPDKIAIFGRCASVPPAARLGLDNLDVFSRIGLVSGSIPSLDAMDLKNKTVEFFIDYGLWEGSDWDVASKLRHDGHPVKTVAGLRGHEDQAESYDFVGHWLMESWAKPDPTTRSALRIVDPVPLLTLAVVNQMTNFWDAFQKQPDSIRTTARQAHLREFGIPLQHSDDRMSVWMTDMPALAAQYPPVAAALTKAGLTPQQHDAYRVALIATRIGTPLSFRTRAADETSVLAKNAAFFRANYERSEFTALEATGMWSTP